MYTYRVKKNRYDHILWRVIPEDDELEIRDFETERKVKSGQIVYAALTI